MNKIKTIIATVAIMFAVGCTTTSENQTPEQAEANRIRRIESGVQIAVSLGATIDLRAHPERRPAYVQASAGLNTLVAQEKWDMTAFALSLSSTGNGAFSSGNVTLLLTSVPQVIDVLTGERVDLSQQKYLAPAIRGASKGLNSALDATK